MSELRHDPIQNRWVIIATERAFRPSDFEVPATPRREVSFCPFCEGHEDRTPPEIFAYREPGSQPNGPGWKVRVIPNKFPALRIEGPLNRKGIGLFDMMSGIGAHEVIIETPEHDANFPDMAIEQIELVLRAYRERLNDLMKDPRFRYILIFKNYGVPAGASLSHPHTQLIATPITPRTVAMEFDSARAHYLVKERCLFCDIIEQELYYGDRVVKVDEHYVVLAPFASRFPFETFIAPRVHNYNFGDITDEEIHHLALTLRDILSRLKISLDNPPYNFVLHTGPNVEAKPRRPDHWETIQFDFHWHLEIIPRVTRIAGFEWGTGFYINPTSPEEATKYLREIKV